jgi:hypothetical protein
MTMSDEHNDERADESTVENSESQAQNQESPFEHVDDSTKIPDDFYVGYLRVPESHKNFATTFVLAIAIWMLGMGGIIVLTMGDPGKAIWDTGSIRSWSGSLLETPYPMLIPDDSTMPPMLVVEMGKLGAHERLSSHFNKRVTLSGYELNRDGRRLIELSPDTDSIKPADSQSANGQSPFELSITHVERTVLAGEIVDGKCYLGAMKPADGLTHRACAMLCIRGGLPPMFVVQEKSKSIAGTETIEERIYYLLIIDGTTDLSEEVLAMVAQPVEIIGEIADMNGMQIIRASSSDIKLKD